jgi:hypothetical protein
MPCVGSLCPTNGDERGSAGRRVLLVVPTGFESVFGHIASLPFAYLRPVLGAFLAAAVHLRSTAIALKWSPMATGWQPTFLDDDWLQIDPAPRSRRAGDRSWLILQSHSARARKLIDRLDEATEVVAEDLALNFVHAARPASSSGSRARGPRRSSGPLRLCDGTHF